MADADTAAAGDFAEYVSHEEFRAGLAAGASAWWSIPSWRGATWRSGCC